MHRWFRLAGGLATAFVLGCGGSAMSPTPVITITSPSENASIALTGAATVDIPVAFSVSNFVLEAPVNQPVVAGHGHCHLLLDADPNYVDAGISPLTARKVGAGAHALRLELHDSSHARIDGVSAVTVDIAVQ